MLFLTFKESLDWFTIILPLCDMFSRSEEDIQTPFKSSDTPYHPRLTRGFYTAYRLSLTRRFLYGLSPQLNTRFLIRLIVPV